MLISTLANPCTAVGRNLPALWRGIGGIRTARRHNLIALRCFCTAPEKEDENVYVGPLTKKMKAVKVFSLTTSITGLIAQPMIIEQASKIGGTALVVFMSGFVGFFTFVTPFLLHWITKNYVSAMKFNASTQEYTATTISFFLTPTYTKFRISDVKVPDVPGMFTTFLVGKKGFFVDAKEFPDTNHFIKIMGYDKPIDFKLELIEDPKGDETSKKNEKTL
ncbi:transmembrane protein 70 homolog, mitochondrial [Phlebotomus argentipes]|uniref:transmembrane protein 70 homolog, mitochondrial n=1 Tax=Phlebotomus argentipes TaxID=94469 RepID=UPI002892B577|nr:transmembrane protein 70 homolog, mitochondrial [Phlebotomus argentipes]